MSNEENYGKIIHKNDDAVIRIKNTHIYVHRRDGDKEILPLGYWLGGNTLNYEDLMKL
jgi:hypothetical protein